MLKYISTMDAATCCGCRACEQVCAHRALQMESNEEGFLYPKLDATKCVNCGLCESVCPMMKAETVRQDEGQAYVAQNKNVGDLKTSSSGGGFIAIAKNSVSKWCCLWSCLQEWTKSMSY